MLQSLHAAQEKLKNLLLTLLLLCTLGFSLLHPTSCPIPSLLVYEFVYISDQSYSLYMCCRIELCHGVTRDCGHGKVVGQGQGRSSGTVLYNTV